MVRRPPDRFVFDPADREQAVLDVIKSARHRLILSLFRCDDTSILDGLAAAVERGVDVRVLMTPRAKGWPKRLRVLGGLLNAMGAMPIRYADPVVKYHAKYIVADRDRALVASLNFTRKCFRRTCDFLLTTHDADVVQGLTKLFTIDCRPHVASRRLRFGSRLIVGPEHARVELTRLIASAARSIRIVDPRLTDPGMRTLLKAKRAEGVSVTVLGREQMRKWMPHGKMTIIDERIGVIGSISLSPPALDVRREVAVIVRSRACVARMNRTFQRLARQRVKKPRTRSSRR